MATGVYVSDVFLGFRKVPHFIIAVMVREKDRSWILRATIDSDIIDNIVRAGWIGKKGDAFIVNRENMLQTTPAVRRQVHGSPPGARILPPPPAPRWRRWTFRGRLPLCHQPRQAQKVGLGDQGSAHGAIDPAAAGQVHGGLDRL